VAYILYGNWHIPLACRDQKFTEGDAFIGYQKDTPAAVVLQATEATDEWKRMEHISVSGPKADKEGEEEEDSSVWKEDVGSLMVLLTCVVHFLYLNVFQYHI